MEVIRLRSYAKINLTLNVTGEENGYHTIDSLVASVDLCDFIVMRKRRRDKLVTIEMEGCGSENIPFDENTAVKAAKSFIKEFDVCGVDITVYKNIPMGAGLGGSSADAAGVLKGLAELHGIDDTAKVKLLADGIGSDVRYMLTGGYARLSGRGDIVKPVESALRLDILLLAPKTGVSSAECYKRFDGEYTKGDGGAEEALVNCDKEELSKRLCNDLTPYAVSILPAVQTAINDLKKFDPLAVNMTGSGSGVYAVFERPEYCTYAISRYFGKFEHMQLKTIVPKIKLVRHGGRTFD